MKPIDVLSALPRTPDIAKVVAKEVRHGEIQTQSQILSFSREMSQKSQTVSEPVKTVAENKVDSESPGGGGTFYDSHGGRGEKGADKDNPGTQHPFKGKVLDIRGDSD